MEEFKALVELGSKLVDSNFFDLTQNKKASRTFLEKIIVEEGEISKENEEKAAMIMYLNKIQKQIKRSYKIYMEADKIICGVKEKEKIIRPSDDWLEYFEDLCTKTSNENIQKIWARVLVKEHLDAGSITKAMMNTLAMLDRSSAIAFEKVCALTYYLECENEDSYYIPLILYDDILSNILKSNHNSNLKEILKKYRGYLPTQNEIEYLSELGLLKLSAVHDESEIYSHEQLEWIFMVGRNVYVTESIYNNINDYYYIPTGQAFYTQTGLALYHALGKKNFRYLYDILKSYIICKKEME